MGASRDHSDDDDRIGGAWMVPPSPGGESLPPTPAAKHARPSSGFASAVPNGASSRDLYHTTNENFKVVIRVRPPLARELGAGKRYQPSVAVDTSCAVCTLSENLEGWRHGVNPVGENGMVQNTHQFTFDHVYDQDASQETVYENSAKPAVMSTLLGYNAAMMAYGQTGTGKTYTMEGDRASMKARAHGGGAGRLPGEPGDASASGTERGIIPRAIEDIFGHIKSDTSTRSKYLVRASYVQIYNEVISDLLKPERANLNIREDKKRGVFVDGLSEWVVRTPDEIYGLMEKGATQRTTGSTKMNELSSRSHAVFIIIVENSKLEEEPGRQELRQSFKVGKLNLVDLAGSERVRQSGATGVRLEETKKINQSLSALGNVIKALTDKNGTRSHVPYRDSKLTRILEDSLGGNCKTTMMAMISPALEAFTESLSTLKFANRAKFIKNTARVNEDLDQKSLLRKYERELKRLRQELDERTKNLVDKRALLQLDEQRRKAEADKMRAITELEARSQEFLKEKREKRDLEQAIEAMQSQMLGGGDTPQFRAMLQEEHERIRTEYEGKMRELEHDRQEAEEGRAQVGRYKAVLLKQRDIMIALTARLNERDETIIRMQEELKAYDKEYRRVEDALDGKTAELIALRRAAMQSNAESPQRNPGLVDALGGWAGTGGGGGGGGATGGGGGGGGSPSRPGAGWGGERSKSEHALRVELRRSEERRRDLEAELDRARGLKLKPPSAGDGGGGGADAARVKIVETQYEQFRKEMASRLEDKNAKLHALEDENNKLKRAAMQTRGGTSAELERVKSKAAAEASVANEKVEGFARERSALKTILESKIATLVEGIARSVKEMPEEARRHPRLTREVNALDRLVHATVQAMES